MAKAGNPPLARIPTCTALKLHVLYNLSVRAVTDLLHAVVSMSLSKAGSPLAVLSDSTAYAYQPGMRTWMRIVDSDFAQSSYASILASGAPGEPAQQ